MDDVEAASGGQFEYTDDVYTDPGKFCMGRESGCEIWMGGLEYMGNLSCDGYTPGLSVGDGDCVRNEGTEKAGGW